MNIKDLKNKILDESLPDSLLILQYTDNTFIINEYIDSIAKFKHKTVSYIDDLREISVDNLFDTDDNCLYVFSCDKLDNIPSQTDTLNNVIIKCKSVDSKLNLTDFIVEIPKLETWQIVDYLKTQLTGISSEEIEWLCNITQSDVYRLKNESDKISIFPKSKQEDIFNLINLDDGYCDLSSMTIFNFTNAFIKKDISTICKVLQDIKYIDIEPTGVVTLLLKDFKHLIDIQLNSTNVTADSLNMSTKQFNAIRYNCGKYSNANLIRIYNTLLSIDSMLKGGELENDRIVDYITVKILGE